MGTFTTATGFGMLAMGMALILTMGLIILKVINTMAENKKELQAQQEREKIYGSN